MHNSEIFRNLASENQVYHETAENGTKQFSLALLIEMNCVEANKSLPQRTRRVYKKRPQQWNTYMTFRDRTRYLTNDPNKLRMEPFDYWTLNNILANLHLHKLLSFKPNLSLAFHDVVGWVALNETFYFAQRSRRMKFQIKLVSSSDLRARVSQFLIRDRSMIPLPICYSGIYIFMINEHNFFYVTTFYAMYSCKSFDFAHPLCCELWHTWRISYCFHFHHFFLLSFQKKNV